jgi:endonuclease/exonuclease/phosphatase family metal-dependent hydrolase
MSSTLSPPPEAVLRVVTWNLHGTPDAPDVEGRLGRVARWVLEDSRAADATTPPDLVLLQEVWAQGQEELLRRSLGASYDLVGVPNGLLFGRTGGLLALVRRDGPLVRVQADFLEFEVEAPEWRIWEGDGFGDKGVQRIVLALGRRRVVAFNTHLQAEYDGTDYSAIRAAQLAQLAKLAAAVPPHDLVLVAGDLNTQPAELERWLLAPDPRWRDLSAELRTRRECWQRHDDGAERWIDYVLAREDATRFRVERAGCMPSQPEDVPFSDHPGLDLKLAVVENAREQSRWLAPALAARLAGPTTRREWIGTALLLALATARANLKISKI